MISQMTYLDLFLELFGRFNFQPNRSQQLFSSGFGPYCQVKSSQTFQAH